MQPGEEFPIPEDVLEEAERYERNSSPDITEEEERAAMVPDDFPAARWPYFCDFFSLAKYRRRGKRPQTP